MALAKSRPMRDQLVDAAIDLFSTKGYAATSVADIQTACGLTAGSGALYKHFSSKEELLREVLRRHAAGIAHDRQEAVANPPEGLNAGLRYLAETVWRSLERDRNVIRITLRDLDPFPDLVDELWDSTLRNVYQQSALLIQHENEHGRIDVADPEATAAVLVASLTYFPILEGLIGRTPGDVDRDRFLDAWVDSAQRTLTPTEAGADDALRGGRVVGAPET